MNRLLIISFLLFLGLDSLAQIDASYIDPFIGTGGHGHTHPSATVPFGMVQIGPDTRKEGWDGCSGYHFTDSTIYGFSHTHLSGTGVSDYSDILFKPLLTATDTSLEKKIAFDKASEIAKAGYYKVKLENGIICEFTAEERTGLHRYTFPEGKSAMFLIDLNYRDEVLDADLVTKDDSILIGYRYSKAWATNQKLHFAAKSNQDFKCEKGPQSNTWIVDFGVVTKPIEFYVGLSSCDIEGAQKNLEASSRDFNKAKKSATRLWNKELNKTQVFGGSKNQRIIFATAIYHAYSAPNLWSDVDGRYRGMDGKIHRDTMSNHYTVFSLWDTYRTTHPLYTISQPQRTNEFIATMLEQFEQSGRLPVWELAANETNCMIAYHSVSVLADALAKGYKIDGNRLIKAMTETATKPVFGLEIYEQNGFLTIQDEAESVSKTLEYSYDDACISWAARHFGMDSIADHYRDRSIGYKSVTDPVTGLVVPRDNGGFLKNAKPHEVNSHFTEANAWQYSFSPVHDIEGWLEYLGGGSLDKGREKLEHNLDKLFVQPEETIGKNQADITGLIGQYAHGNEPSHHIAYLYSATKSPHKGQKRVSEIIQDFYSNEPDGLIGNEDCGQMSAWYVMSTIGIYPLVPGKADYILTAPLWDSVTVELPNNNQLLIEAFGQGPYIEKVTINGESWNVSSISHDEILKGGRWKFYRSESPQEWASQSPYNTDMNSMVLAAPIINGPRRFENSAEVNFEIPRDGYELVVWQENGKPVDMTREGELVVTESTTFYSQFNQVHTGHRSQTSSITLTKKPSKWKAEIKEGTPHMLYQAGGEDALVDGILGDLDWRKGNWMGFQNQDVTVEIVHPQKTNIDDITVHLLKDIRSWIALPDTVSLWAMKKGAWVLVDERIIGAKALELDQSALYTVEWDKLELEGIDKLKIVMKNPGVLPEAHLSAGNESYIFIDEIAVISR